MRGTEANHLLVMIDGVPANAVGDGEYNFADIAIDDIERIELLRGPQSGLYGANAHSGVLTIVTKSGRGLTKPEFNARFEAGTQKSAEAAATFRGAVGPVYGSITATAATTNGFNIARDGNETGRRQAWRRHRQGRHRPDTVPECGRLPAPLAAAWPQAIRKTRSSRGNGLVVDRAGRFHPHRGHAGAGRRRR